MEVLKLLNVVKGKFKSRPNRFLVEMQDGTLAHLHDPGRLKELLISDVDMLLLPVESTNRKTNYDIVAVKYNDYWVFLNSAYHSKIAEQIIPRMFGNIKDKEVKFGDSRIDFLLEDGRPLEVKGSTLLVGDTALFPDAPTKRGARHVREITKHNGAMLFLIFHPGAKKFTPNCSMDPEFCEAVFNAKKVDIRAAVLGTKLVNNTLVVEWMGEIPVIT